VNTEPSGAKTPTPVELAVRLRAAVGVLVRATRGADRLAPIPAAVLDLLARRPMTTAELAESRGVRHQTMAATVRDLTETGYVAAAPDPGDARKKILTVTAAGHRALDADRRRRVALIAGGIEQALGPQDRRDLAHALDLVERVTATVAEGDGEPVTGAW
jgi:DNA-binding MarR family transcriptional regulator